MTREIFTGLTIDEIDDLNEKLGFINGQLGVLAAVTEADLSFQTVLPREIRQLARAAQEEVERVNTILSNAEKETKKEAGLAGI